jgi:hypothetical protein
MAKFEGAEDRGYRAVRREVRRWIKILGDHQNEAKENTITATHCKSFRAKAVSSKCGD